MNIEHFEQIVHVFGKTSGLLIQGSKMFTKQLLLKQSENIALSCRKYQKFFFSD